MQFEINNEYLLSFFENFQIVLTQIKIDFL